jgi:hypothetical protein
MTNKWDWIILAVPLGAVVFEAASGNFGSERIR